MKYFDYSKQLSNFIDKNYSKSDAEKLHKYFLVSDEKFRAGTYVSRINLMTRRMANEVIARGGHIYLACVEEDIMEFKSLSKFSSKHLKEHQRSSRMSIINVKESHKSESESELLEGLFGSTSKQYLVDAFIIDFDTALIIIEIILSK